MKRFLAYITFILATGQAALAQQDAIYSQYMFNPFMINPAYAGSRDALSGVLLFRQQWVGIDGAPQTETFSVHSMIGKTQLTGGLNVVNDVIGPSRNTGVFGTAAYHLKLGKGKLSFGLRGGVYDSRLDNSKLNYYNQTDRFNTQATVNTIVPSYDGGLYYYTRQLYLGLSTTHLSQSQINYNNFPSGTNLYLRRHYMLAAGYAFEVSRNLVFKPSTLIKYVEGAPLNIDLNASFLLYKKVWLGVSARSRNGIVFMAEFYPTDWFRVGYSYDLALTRLRKYTQGTHEVVIGFDLNVKRVKHISPRYL